ncbi:MAG TPA: pirin family protein [Marmoricola sp.]|nr:pirin family protein [Marmoricola sp.]
MSNLERDPGEITLATGDTAGVEILVPRSVPLGGPRAMTVRRTLPQRSRSLVGAWCFLDHYGPDDVADTGGMRVAPHPHTGLQTVSWLFTGEIEHRDSAGHHALVRRGELNLMTAGRGISHSEVSTPGTTTLHGAQLWVALPADARETDPAFEHYAPPVVSGTGWQARVFLGSLLGHASPVRCFTELVGAELLLDAGAEVVVPVDPDHEHAVLVDEGGVRLAGRAVARHELGYLGTGASSLTLQSNEGARLLLLGGRPLGEQIVMWWNFVGRSHEEVVAYRADWQRLLEGGSGGRFTLPEADPLPPIPAPGLPNARLRSRG